MKQTTSVGKYPIIDSCAPSSESIRTIVRHDNLPGNNVVESHELSIEAELESSPVELQSHNVNQNSICIFTQILMPFNSRFRPRLTLSILAQTKAII